jgi:hypothetical protein
MSALPPRADIGAQSRNVRFAPKADCRLLWLYVDLLLNNNRLGERKCGALARLRPNPNPSPVHLNDALRYGKPQAGLGLDDRCRGSPDHRRTRCDRLAWLHSVAGQQLSAWRYAVPQLALPFSIGRSRNFSSATSEVFPSDLAGSSGRIAAILLPLYYLADSTVTLQTRSPAKPVTLTATRGRSTISSFLLFRPSRIYVDVIPMARRTWQISILK